MKTPAAGVPVVEADIPSIVRPPHNYAEDCIFDDHPTPELLRRAESERKMIFACVAARPEQVATAAARSALAEAFLVEHGLWSSNYMVLDAAVAPLTVEQAKEARRSWLENPDTFTVLPRFGELSADGLPEVGIYSDPSKGA